MSTFLLKEYIQKVLNEAVSSYGSIREMYVDGQWYSIVDNDSHESFVIRYYKNLGIDLGEDLDFDNDDFINKFIKEFDAIRRHGKTFLVKKFNKETLKILQEHVSQINIGQNIWVGCLIPPQNCYVPIDEFMNAKSFKELNVLNGLRM